MKQDALMMFPYQPEQIHEAGLHFDRVVERIQAKEFDVSNPPEAGICKECDLRHLCTSDGTVR